MEETDELEPWQEALINRVLDGRPQEARLLTPDETHALQRKAWRRTWKTIRDGVR